MTMRSRFLLVLLALLALVPSTARAQDFGLLESGEIIDRGNFKIRVNPMLILGRDGQDGQTGAAIVAGYGFTSRFDAEGGLAFYDGVTFFGGNGELALLEDGPFHFSVAAGLHGRRGDGTARATGVDLTFIPTKHVTPKLDLYGALDFAFESIGESYGGGTFKTVHLVPGLEYRMRPDLDLVAEFGIALNDAASHYVSAGLAFYLR
jgi:hypothetical protein